LPTKFAVADVQELKKFFLTAGSYLSEKSRFFRKDLMMVLRTTSLWLVLRTCGPVMRK
jgi:hypothetical protein